MVLKFYNLGNSWKSNPTLNIYIFLFTVAANSQYLRVPGLQLTRASFTKMINVTQYLKAYLCTALH